MTTVDTVARQKAQTAYEIAVSTQNTMSSVAKELADHRIEASNSSHELRSMLDTVLTKLGHVEVSVNEIATTTAENKDAIDKLKLRVVVEDTEKKTEQDISDKRSAWWGKWGTTIGLILASGAAVATMADSWQHHTTITTTTYNSETHNEPARDKK